MKNKLSILGSLLITMQSALAQSQFYFTSSPTSYVGQGQTQWYKSDHGDSFALAPSSGNGLHLLVNGVSGWWLDFEAPGFVPLSVGTYNDAHRYPFQGSGPGLSFFGQGRGYNISSGSFTVLEIMYGTDNKPISAAIDFTQYGEQHQSEWNFGSIRYNSSLPITVVPEPSTLVLVGSALSFLVFKRRHLAGLTT